MLVVAPVGVDKTAALNGVRKRTGAPLINGSLGLSRRILELTERQRTLHLPRLLRKIVSNFDGEIILFENIDVIFDVCLKQNPLRLLQGFSRNKAVVAAWRGSIIHDFLTCAVPDHPKCKRYPMRDFLVASHELET